MIFLRSVKFRLTLWYAFILTFLLSLFSFLLHAELARALNRDVDQRLFYEAKNLENSLKIHLKDYSDDQIPASEKLRTSISSPVRTPEKLRKSITEWEKSIKGLRRSTQMVRIQGLDHSLYLSNLTGWERDIIFPDFERDSAFMESGRSFQTIHFQKKPIRLYYHLVEIKKELLLVIQCGTSLHEVQSALQRLAFIILISIPGAVAAACIAGWFLVKRSFRPVDLMIREARNITAAYLKGRLPRTSVGDELDRLAETLNEMMDRIEASTRAVQDFSSDISHELRTPLAIIRGEIDLALRRPRAPEALIQTLRVIEGEVNELIRLVDDLILLVRSDAKQLRFEIRMVSLDELLAQVCDRFEQKSREKKIDFKSEVQPDVFVKGDELYLKRLFSNLVDNAIKFTPEGGSIRVLLRSDRKHALVEVEDTGMGIEAELQTKVFSRFYRTDQARSHEGSGLGLNIAKAISDAHQGSIRIHSNPGKGTLVSVSLPIAP
jgi:heavy metal sensor kinase